MATSEPQRIFCRVDVDKVIWVLVGYGADVKRWEKKVDEVALQTFLARAGGRVVCPPKCLTPEQAAKIVSNAKNRIAKLEDTVAKYKLLLDKALSKPSAGSSLHRGSTLPTTSVASPNIGSTMRTSSSRTNTGSSLGTYTTADTRASNISGVSLENKLGSYPTTLQNKFSNNLKNAPGGATAANSDSEASESAILDPSPGGFHRTTSSGYLDTVALSRKSSVQELKSLLREQKAQSALPSSLDPYLTDGSDAASTSSFMASSRLGQSYNINSKRSKENSVGSLAVGTGTAVNTPSSEGHNPTLFPSDDEGCYWSESDAGYSACDFWQRDVGGGGISTDEDYTSDVGSRSESPLLEAGKGTGIGAGAEAGVGSELRHQRVSTATATATATATIAAAGASSGIAGIALKEDSCSRESAGVLSAAHPRLPKRSQSVESVGSNSNHSNNSNKSNNSNNSNLSAKQRGATSSQQDRSDRQERGDWPPPAAYGVEEDSCMSLRLSQDDDESRSMLFTHLREDSTMEGAPRAPTAGSGSGATSSVLSNTSPSKGFFGMVMSVANYLPQMLSSVQTQRAKPTSNSVLYPVTKAVAATATTAGESKAESKIIEQGQEEEDEDEATVVEEELDGEDGRGKTLEGKKGYSDTVSMDAREAPGESTNEPMLNKLTVDFTILTADKRGKLKEFERVIRKARLPSDIQAALLHCLLTKQSSPIDAAIYVTAALRIMLHNAASTSKKVRPDKRKQLKTITTTQNTCKLSSEVMDILNQTLGVLRKLFSRNKKIIPADALTVSTICAASVMHTVLVLEFFGTESHLITPDLSTSLTDALTLSMDRLALMLDFAFVSVDDVPWLLQHKGSVVVIYEHDDLAHIERLVHILSARFSGTAAWSELRSTILRYDYAFQRNLISPVKVRPSTSIAIPGAAKEEALKTKQNDESTKTGAIQLFDILSCPSQPLPAGTMPPTGRIHSNSGIPNISSKSISSSAMLPPAMPMKSLAIAGAAENKTKTAAVPTPWVSELTRMTRKRKAGAELNQAAPSSGDSSTTEYVTKDSAGPAPVAPAVKRRNALLSEKPKQVGHRTSMGVGKRVVISAKTLAATAAASAAVASKVNQSLRSAAGGSSSSSSRMHDDALTKTPRKTSMYGPGTPISSNDDYLLFSQGSAMRGAASAMRHRNSAVIESTPMEALQPRREARLTFSANHLTDHITYMSSPSPDASTRRRRAPSTACSKSSTSSGESSSRAGNRLSSLFNTQDDGDCEDAEEDGEDLPPSHSLLAQGDAQRHARRAFLNESGLHYHHSVLPSQEYYEQEEKEAGGQEEQPRQRRRK